MTDKPKKKRTLGRCALLLVYRDAKPDEFKTIHEDDFSMHGCDILKRKGK